MPPIPDRDVVRYLRLEEGDETAERLLPTSVRYLGVHATPSGAASHFWSYPTATGVGWVELREGGALGIAQAVPQAVRDATPERSAHKMRAVRQPVPALPIAQRQRPERAVWVPLAELPACHLHEAWIEQASFDAAVQHYGATVTRGSWAGPGCRIFHLQLTSGRYASLESRRHFPQTVIVSLELDTRRAGKHCGGHMHVRDIEEVLAPMGGTFKMPTANLFIGWRTDD